jgi:peptidyl-prolyl cis-trans isomerase C
LTREPLVHFLIAGFALYAAGRFYERRHDIYRIEVTPARVAQLAETYRKQYGATPDAAMREILVQRDIDNEVLYREGLRLKLDQDDEVVRRRTIQKMEFLAQNLGAPAEPTDAQVEAYYRGHLARYIHSPTASFTHIYYSADQTGSSKAQARAQSVLLRLRASDRSRAPELGDPFPDRYDFAGVSAGQVQRLFGRSSFAEEVFDVPVGQWSGPFLSGYGWHLLHVDARTAVAQAPLGEVREQVRSDLLAEALDRQNRADFQELRRRFTVVRSDGAL